MKILAITESGREFLYNPKSARQVSNASAEKIAAVVNAYKYKLQPGQVWHCYDVDKYDTAFVYASGQRFTIRKGIVKDCRCY